MSQSQAVIGYNNLFLQAQSVTATSEVAGYEARNAWDGTNTSFWQPSATGTQTLTLQFSGNVTADYFGLFAHNLTTAGATIGLQFSTDSGTTWTDCFASFMPADNACIFKKFTAQTASWWRVIVNAATSAPFIGVLNFGPSLTMYRGMPVGFVPPADARSSEIMPSTTMGGNFSGRSVIPLGAQMGIINQCVPVSWVRSYWRDFVKWAEKMPFFFSWNIRDFPEEAVYAIGTTQNSGSSGSQQGLQPVTMAEYGYYQINFPITALMGAGGGA